MNVGKIHSFREVLPEQAVRVLVGAALPGTLWIAEVDLDVRVQGEAFVIGQFFTAIPGERLVELTALGPHTGRKALTLCSLPPTEKNSDIPLLARAAGFSLHAASVCEAHQRGRLERLCRYITRPPA